MAVNRFNKPLATDVQQTYVSQFVPLPFDLISKRIDREEESFAKNKGAADALRAALGDKVIQYDNPIMDSFINNANTIMDEKLSQYKGDYRQLDQTTKDIANQYKQFITTGQGALLLTNKATRDKNIEDIDKSNIESVYKDRIKQYDDLNYEDAGGGAAGNQYRTTKAYDLQDFNKKVIESIDKLKTDETSDSTYYIDENNGLIVEKDSQTARVSDPRILAAVATTLDTDANWNDMIKTQYKVDSRLGYMPTINGKQLSLDEFRKYKLDQVKANKAEAFGYTQTKTKYGVKETAEHAARGTKEGSADISPAVTNNQQQAMTAAESLDGVDGIQSYKKNVSKYNDANIGALRGIYTSQNGNKSEEEFNNTVSKNMQSYYKNTHMSWNTPNMRNMFFQDIANGYVKMEDLQGIVKTQAQYEDLKKTAKANLAKREKYERVYLDAAKDLVGKDITKEEYAAYEKHFEAAYDDKPTKGRKTSEFVVYTAPEDAYRDPTKAKAAGIASVSAPVAKVMAALDKQDEFIKGRVEYAKNVSINVNSINAIPTLDKSGKGYEYNTQKWEEVRKVMSTGTMKENMLTNTVFSYVDDKGKVVDVEGVSALADLELQKDATYQTLLKDPKKASQAATVKKEKETELLSSMNLMTSFEPGTKDAAITIGKYKTVLSPGKNNQMYTTIFSNMSADAKVFMSVQSNKLNLLNSPAESIRVVDGIELVCDGKPSSVSVQSLGNFDTKIKLSPVYTAGKGTVILTEDQTDEFLTFIEAAKETGVYGGRKNLEEYIKLDLVPNFIQ